MTTVVISAKFAALDRPLLYETIENRYVELFRSVTIADVVAVPIDIDCLNAW
jgi:hypothetical protein